MMAPIILFIIFVVSAYYVVKPLLSPTASLASLESKDEYTAKELDKITLLKQIREVEFEKEMGITSEEDFERIRSELQAEVGKLIQEEEEGKKTSAASSRCNKCGESINTGDKFCGHCGAPQGQATCTGCGNVLPDGAKFCPICGKPVK